MVDHHLQKRIIVQLVECETAHYAELKPPNIEGNVFTYHLKALLRDRLIEKTIEGTYQLTNAGKLFGINASLKKKEILAQAHPIILLSILDGDRWLLRKRLVQPLYGKIGFIHGEPMAGQTIEEAAAATLKRRTGLTGEFVVRGSGYIRFSQDEELIAFSQFTLLKVSKLKGTLIKSDQHGENIWLDKPDFNGTDMIPSMLELVKNLSISSLFFVDLNLKV